MTNSDVLPKSEILIALRNAGSIESTILSRGEQDFIKSIGEDWESKVIELLKRSPKYSENGPSITKYYWAILAKVADLHKIENLWESLMKLPDASIQELVFLSRYNALTLDSYFKIYNLVNASKVVLIKEDFSNITQIAETVSAVDIHERTMGLSQYFLNLTKFETNFFYTTSSSLPPTCIILLAGIYGERRVTSIILQKRSNKIEF